MAKVHEGRLDASGRRIAIIAGRYNDFITKKLVASAVDCVERNGGSSESVDVYWVPGAFEVPQLAAKVADSRRFDGIVCLGAIIRGETNHFDNLCDSVISSIAGIPARSGVPVTYGIVTAENVEQAADRAGGAKGNKGWEATLALIELMSLWGESTA